MPERIYDSDFASRVVRTLQLKFGRGPGEVDEVIVPVIDLSRLLSRAAQDLDFFKDEDTDLSVKSLTYSAYAPARYPMGVNDANFMQLYNPVGSERLVIIRRIVFVFGAALMPVVRLSTAALANVAVNFGTLNHRGPGDAPRAQVRQQVLTSVPAFPEPPTGAMSGILLTLGSAGNGTEALVGGVQRLTVEPGHGIVWHLAFDPGDNTVPQVQKNTSWTNLIIWREVPFLGT